MEKKYHIIELFFFFFLFCIQVFKRVYLKLLKYGIIIHVRRTIVIVMNEEMKLRALNTHRER